MIPLDCVELYEDADFYDLEFASRAHEIPFFQRHSLRAAGPVLEIACGTGRITRPLARAGVPITGLDVSPQMIAQARRHSADERLAIEWTEQDCRTFSLPQRFALIFSATNAMQHLLDRDSLRAFLSTARDHLAPGGHLLLDVFNPDIAKLARPAGERYHHKTIPLAEGGELRVEAASEYFPATQVLHFDLSYLRGPDLIRTKSVNMRCLFPEELLALCETSALEVVERWGDYDETPFHGASPKQLLLCRRYQAT